MIPHAAQIATLIEFAHRLSSGMAVILVVVLMVFAFRQFTSGHPARRCAAAALLFTLTEGLIGAALVVFGQVGNNASMSRALILSLHLINTFLLLASLTLTAKSASAARPGVKPLEDIAPAGEARIANSEPLLLWYAVGLLGALAMAVTRTITALGDTLFHSTSLAQGFQLDFSAAASPLLRLRVIHPLIAVAAGGYLILLAVRAVGSPVSPSARRLACWLLALVTFQFLLSLLESRTPRSPRYSTTAPADGGRPYGLPWSCFRAKCWAGASRSSPPQPNAPGHFKPGPSPACAD